MKTKLRVAMAGAGFASGHHLARWRRLDNVERVAICDPAEAKTSLRAEGSTLTLRGR